MKRWTVFLVVLVLAACGGGSGSSSTTSTRPAVAPIDTSGGTPIDTSGGTPIDTSGDTSGGTSGAEVTPHSGPLQSHETADLASLLVTVPGYRYVDVSADEQAAMIDRLHDIEREIGVDGWFARASLHSVVADDPSLDSAHTRDGSHELGFLALTQHSETIPSRLVDDPAFAASMLEVDEDELVRLELAGTVVFRHEDPDRPDSRFQYSWVRHGVIGYLDGAVAADLEAWLTAALAVTPLADGETEPLVARLTPIDGFAYVDAIDLEPLHAAIVEQLGDLPRTAHQIAGPDGSVGTLVLLSTAVDRTVDLTSVVVDLLGAPDASEGRRIAGTEITEVTFDEGLVDLWFDDGVTAMLFRSPGGEGGERFLEAYVDATTA